MSKPRPVDTRGFSHWRRHPARANEWFDAEEIRRGRAYVRPLAALGAVQWVLGAALVVAFVEGERAADVVDAAGARGWVIELIVIAVALEIVSLVFRPWFSAWRVFVHDRRWGLSTQRPRGWVGDQVKELLLGIAVTLLLVVPLYALLRATDAWWIWGWLLFTGFGVLVGFLFPIVLAPLFNRFRRLDDDTVAPRVRAVAERAGLRLEGVYVADASVRSRATNAYVAGLGATRRAVLFDTILEWPPELLDQVVAHELGHWRHGHIARQIPFLAGVQLLAFAALWRVFESQSVLEWAGATQAGDPRTLPLFLLVYPLVLGGASLALAWLSRAFERQADVYALAVLDDPASFQAAFRRLASDNKADVDPPWWRRVRHSHPPVPERMAMAEAWRRSDRHTPTAR